MSGRISFENAWNSPPLLANAATPNSRRRHVPMKAPMNELLNRLLQRLDNVREVGGQWSALCPAHDDHHNSLSIGQGEDGRVLLHCHAGCSVETILAKLDLLAADLFP